MRLYLQQVVSGMGLSDVYEYLALEHPEDVNAEIHGCVYCGCTKLGHLTARLTSLATIGNGRRQDCSRAALSGKMHTKINYAQKYVCRAETLPHIMTARWHTTITLHRMFYCVTFVVAFDILAFTIRLWRWS